MQAQELSGDSKCNVAFLLDKFIEEKVFNTVGPNEGSTGPLGWEEQPGGRFLYWEVDPYSRMYYVREEWPRRFCSNPHYSYDLILMFGLSITPLAINADTDEVINWEVSKGDISYVDDDLMLAVGMVVWLLLKEK